MSSAATHVKALLDRIHFQEIVKQKISAHRE